MAEIVIQMGHTYRTRGATGGYNEQKIVEAIGRRLTGTGSGARYSLAQTLLDRSAAIAGRMLREHGHTVHLITADQSWTFGRVDAFISLHCDSSNSSRSSGASVGYPSTGGRVLAGLWKKHYARNGWPYGFIRDNYTGGLRYYYYYRRANAISKMVVEHGFTTNRDNYRFITSSAGQRAACLAVVDAIGEGFGHPRTPGDVDDRDPGDENMKMRNGQAARVGQRYLLSAARKWNHLTDAEIRRMWGGDTSAIPDGVWGDGCRHALARTRERVHIPDDDDNGNAKRNDVLYVDDREILRMYDVAPRE